MLSPLPIFRVFALFPPGLVALWLGVCDADEDRTINPVADEAHRTYLESLREENNTPQRQAALSAIRIISKSGLYLPMLTP